jgi:hypothetical protein
MTAQIPEKLRRRVEFEKALRAGGAKADRLVASESFGNLDLSQTHINYALTNLSIAYTNAAFLAETVAPVVPTDKQSNKYFVYGFERFRRRQDLRSPGARPKETGWTVSSNTYYADGHMIRGWYPWEGPANADPAIDLDVDTTEVTTDQVLLAQECNLVDLLKANCLSYDLSTAVFGGTAGQYQFDNANTDPIAFFDVQKESVAKAIGRQPNTLLFGRPGWRAFRNNPNVLKHIYGTTVLAPDKQITPEMASEKLEIPTVLIAEAMYDTVPEGEAHALDYIWGDLALLFYRDPGAGRRKLNLATTFLWNTGVMGRIVEKWYDQDQKRWNIDVSKFYSQTLTASGAGILYKNTSSVDAGGEVGA